MSSFFADFLQFKGAYVNLYTKGTMYMFRNFQGDQVTAEWVNATYSHRGCADYADVNELKTALEQIFDGGLFLHGEFMNWGRNQTYQTFTDPHEYE